MALEAELVYRAQNSGGRKDAAYVIEFLAGEISLVEKCYQVAVKWGSWGNYLNATLQSKNLYVGNSYSIAHSKVLEAANKRTQRGYELQARLSTFPAWYPGPYAPTVTIAADDSRLRQALAETQAQPPPEPEPLPAGRVKHTRAGFIEL